MRNLEKKRRTRELIKTKTSSFISSKVVWTSSAEKFLVELTEIFVCCEIGGHPCMDLYLHGENVEEDLD